MATVEIANLKVLIVDDHLLARKMTERILVNIGFKNMDQAATADEAREKLNAGHYDLILLDWHMPGSSGYNLLQTCRADRKYDNIAFIIISAESGPRFISEAMKAGATSYIVKPFTDVTLREHVNKALVWLEQRIATASAANSKSV